MRKVAWPYDPKQVLKDLGTSKHPGAARAAKRVQRGSTLFSEIGEIPQMGRDAVQMGRSLGRAVVSPAQRIGAPVLKGLGGIAGVAKRNPRIAAAALGTAALAPMIANTAHQSQQEQEGQLMNAYRDPSLPMVVTASLDEFLEKKAAQLEFGFPGAGAAILRGIGNTMRDKSVESFAAGIGAGMGKGLLDASFGALGGIYDKIRTALVTDPRRQKLVESIVRNDPVISDAVERQPNGSESVWEAYATMVRFAPSISLDPNAVRSWLREAVLSGGTINYAAVKNLIETEKALADSRRGAR